MDSKETSDPGVDVSTPDNETVASLSETVATDSNSLAAVVSDSGTTLVASECTTTPVTTPVTRRRQMASSSQAMPKVAVINDPNRNSTAEIRKATDSSSTSTLTTASSESNDLSEAVLAVMSDNPETVETEALAPPVDQNSTPSTRKRSLKISRSLDPIQNKRARSSKSEAKDSPTSTSSSVEKFPNAHSISKKLRSMEVSDSPALGLSPERTGSEETSATDALNSDMSLAEHSLVSELNESVAESPESPKKGNHSPGKGKKVRNPYGRRGKPGKDSTAIIHPVKTKKAKESKVSVALPPKTKVDAGETETVRPEWLKPFEEGWRREIVFRNTAVDSTAGRKCDIYYFTPDNCKLRSTPQIVSYLSKQKSDLIGSCFTFVKRQIHSEPAEFVRNAVRKKFQKEKETKTVSGTAEVSPAFPSLKLKLKRQKFKKSLSKIQVVLSGGIASDATTSVQRGDCDVLMEEPQFHSTPSVSAHVEPFVDSSLPSLDSDGSTWKLMKPKKVFSKKQSPVPLKTKENESEQVAGNVCPPLEIPDLPLMPLLLPFGETESPMDVTNTSDSDIPSIDTEDIQNKDNEKIVIKDNENIRNMDSENIKKQDSENVENMDNENVENMDNENIKKDSGNIQKDIEHIENIDSGNMENNENFSNNESRSELKLSLSPVRVAAVKVIDEGGDARISVKKKSSGKASLVAKKSLSRRVRHGGSDAKRFTVRMLYSDGMPQRVDRHGLDFNDASSVTSPVMYNSVSDSSRPCGLHCARQYGLAPSLHCDICMCVFHPECVGITHVPHRKSFTCKACYTLNADFSGSFSESTQPHPLPPQPRRTPSTISLPLPSSTPLSTHFSSFPQVTSAVSASTVSASVVQKVSVAGIDRSSPTGHVLSLPHSLASLLNLSRPVTLVIDGQKYTIPGSCFMVTADSIKVVLPNNLFASLSVQKTTIPPLHPCSDHATNILPDRHLDALQTMTQSEVPLKTSPTERGSGKEMQSCGKAVRGGDAVERLKRVAIHALDDPKPSVGEMSQLTTQNSPSIITDSSGCCGVEEDDNDSKGSSFSMIASNAELVLRIFKFLNIVDLLKASRVCAAWRKIAECSSLWKVVNLGGVKVIDWDLAAQRLTKHRTQSLDLSRLVHCGSENQTWHQLTGAFSSLTTVQHLVLGPCPANLVYSVASKMTELQSLTAKEIVDVGGEYSTNIQTPRVRGTKLDVGKMAVLRNLFHLELRGLHGLILPGFSFTDGLTELSQLTRLKHLSITSLREVPGKEFQFLSSLENLKVLEIGECKRWEKEDYERLSGLTQLKRLKLECVVDSTETGLGLALARLSQLEHLELHSFRISKSSADALSTMSQLKALHLYSDTCEEAASSNSYMLSAVKSMKFLVEMTWTILTSHHQTEHSDDRSSAGNPQLEKLLPFLLETGSDGDVGKSSTVEWKSVGELESALKEDLLSTTVRVVADEVID